MMRVLNQILFKYLDSHCHDYDELYECYNSIYMTKEDICLIAASANPCAENSGYFIGIVPVKHIDAIENMCARNNLAIAYELKQCAGKEYYAYKNIYVPEKAVSAEEALSIFNMFHDFWSKKRDYLDAMYQVAWKETEKRLNQERGIYTED